MLIGLLQAEGKIAIRLDKGKDEENWHLSVGCSVPGKWILHWGVNYAGDAGRLVWFDNGSSAIFCALEVEITKV